MKWLYLNSSPLKIRVVKTVKTIRVITSWITFSWTSVKEPPLLTYPIRLAGTWKQYSKNAIPQLIRITANKPRFLSELISLNFRWPYHAKVINVFDSIKSPMVESPFISVILVLKWNLLVLIKCLLWKYFITCNIKEVINISENV